MEIERLLNFIFYSGRYFTIMGTLLTLAAILNNYDVYKGPKHLKEKFHNRRTKLAFSIFIAWIIPGITGSISEVFANKESIILHLSSEIVRGFFIFIYSIIIPIVVFYIFQKKYYRDDN
ncbi:hypothetical protein LGK97_17665 [Clostridium sp. CS001]|uniref:hypothetical protein n=1 Tax=Clostridium sp. CS001 TaxID=2880648 RepID=UPI001CF3CC21|nr:hypothetical protein [Clostridium sp. CS001]MCB2291553.1 hypothetical protein [Clostridium sp. CS001]